MEISPGIKKLYDKQNRNYWGHRQCVSASEALKHFILKISTIWPNAYLKSGCMLWEISVTYVKIVFM